ncbi:MAG TPA: hypothetical protein VIJ51_09025 [Solirubrobacteraceae bacterium]
MNRWLRSSWIRTGGLGLVALAIAASPALAPVPQAAFGATLEHRAAKPAGRAGRTAMAAKKHHAAKKKKHSKLPKPKPKKPKPKPSVGIPKDPVAPVTRPASTGASQPGAAGTGRAPATSTSPTEVVGELSDGQAAGLVTGVGETRTDNATDNQTVPTAAQLAAFRSGDQSMPAGYLARIDGAYRGTTDEIIQWAAYKWGLDPQLMRAVAAVESWWHMSTVGDGGNAFGLYQLDARYHCCEALAQTSTAFAADYYGGIVRSYYDGAQTWLNTVSGNGKPYAAGDLWDSVGYWASGRWDTPATASYDAQVQSDLSQQVWLGQWF